jgi:hypothetical protein
MRYKEITNMTTIFVLSRIVRFVLEPYLSIEEINKFYKNEIDVEFDNSGQIPLRIKVWIEDKGKQEPLLFEVPTQFRKTITEVKNDLLESSKKRRFNRPLKEKVNEMAGYILLSCDQSEIFFWEGMLRSYEEDPDYFLIKTKMDQIVVLLNSGLIKNYKIEGDEFVVVDIEEIWPSL